MASNSPPDRVAPGQHARIQDLGLPADLLAIVVALVLRGEDAAAREIVRARKVSPRR